VPLLSPHCSKNGPWSDDCASVSSMKICVTDSTAALLKRNVASPGGPSVVVELNV